MKKVLFISNDIAVLEHIQLCIPPGITVVHIESFEEFNVEKHQHQLSLVIVDTDCLYNELAAQWQRWSSLSIPVIALSSSEKCFRLLRMPGSFIRDVIQKPVSKEEVNHTIMKHMIDTSPYHPAPESDDGIADIFIGNSHAMKNVRNRIRLFAQSEEPVLICGESGTGKEVAAKCIATLSRNGKKKLITQNIAAIPETLIETTLFGSVYGAFTGARNLEGLFSSCGDGTVFLDEIGEISQQCQVKLLRILETGEFSKIGSCTVQKSQARILCATNKNLEKAVEEKTFRLDLYYRIRVLHIEIPPLRDRPEDIPILTEHFLKPTGKSIHYDALDYLCGLDWPGNARELLNTLKSAALYCRGKKISLKNIKGEF
ncbi:MAG: sigma-54-dependent Fis family transcriptional regulator [Spirochaetales bacterium]|nr:sigma-54-dependent Fis family transcriptional regulator [Spirochaetales bacterium]